MQWLCLGKAKKRVQLSKGGGPFIMKQGSTGLDAVGGFEAMDSAIP
jgi:hypothetical protein